MLTRLDIKDLAIIDHLQPEFSTGFNVITGETGAGKSVLIKSLHLLLGGKANSNMIRIDSQQAFVSASFEVNKNHRAISILEKLGFCFSTDEKQDLLIKRTMTKKNRSQVWINDTPVTMATLKEVGSSLIDIFAQHDDQKLLDESKHIHYVDAFLSKQTTKTKVKKQHQKCLESLSKIQKSLNELAEKQKSYDYTLFRHKELEELNPSLEDYQELTTFCAEAEVSMKEKEIFSTMLSSLENSQDQSISAALWSSLRDIPEHSLQTNPNALNLFRRMTELAKECDEIHYELNRAKESFSLNSSELERAQTRIARYQSNFRKLAVDSAEDLIEIKNKLQEDLDFVSSAGSHLEDMLLDLLKQCIAIEASCTILKVERTSAAKRLESMVRQEFQDLAMPQARILTDISPYKTRAPQLDFSLLGEETRKTLLTIWQKCEDLLTSFREEGSEKVRFLLVTNAGQDPMPLNKIASGGEISRILLALKKSLMNEASTCVLVFDEIDKGISGRVADMVGRKLKELSDDAQVICISHLAQVAAYATIHMNLSKEGHKSYTRVNLRPLGEEDRIKELARLLSGSEITASSIANARSIAEHCRQSVLH